MSQNQSLDHML